MPGNHFSGCRLEHAHRSKGVGVLQDPVDLSLIKQRLDSREYYLTLHIFIADVNRMCANARIYNSAETIYSKLANKVEAFLDEYIHSHVVNNNP